MILYYTVNWKEAESMLKTPVTPELSNMLKTLRLQKNIQAKELALKIGRSPAYITKLEKGDVKNIESELLDNILNVLSDGDPESDGLVDKIYAIQKQYPSNDEIEEQLWFVNFDTVMRRIPIPDKLISYMLEKISMNKIDRSTLLKRINNNEALTPAEKQDETIEHNRWFSSRNNTSNSIKILLSDVEMNGILDRTMTFASYIYVFCILFYILKIERFKEIVDITEDENKLLMDETTKILNEYKFYSLAEKSKIIATAETQEQINELWNSFDTENQQYISDILAGLKFASELDIETTNIRLKSFSENIHWDIWFMLKLISLKYSELDELSTTVKKDFLKEIEDIILKYKNLPKSQKNVETY